MHCDDYVENLLGDAHARWFLFIERLPASLRMLASTRIPDPQLFADHEGKRVRVTMASRMGDVGITHNLAATRGYELRVGIDTLTNFGETP